MNIGDKVKFLNETGGGVITKFIDPETVLVRIEDGFEVPVKLKGLIADTGGTLDSTPDVKIKVKDASPEVLKKEKLSEKKTGAEKQKPPEIVEVDLHIYEIVEDESGLTDGEILDIQLRRFEMALETALHGNIKKIVFIHGVGQGKLKYEISKIMDKKYPDLKYQDASFKEYGYGATMILL